MVVRARIKTVCNYDYSMDCGDEYRGWMEIFLKKLSRFLSCKYVRKNFVRFFFLSVDCFNEGVGSAEKTTMVGLRS